MARDEKGRFVKGHDPDRYKYPTGNKTSGQFKKGHDSRRYLRQFTTLERQKGYEKALITIMNSIGGNSEYWAKKVLFKRMERTAFARVGQILPPPLPKWTDQEREQKEYKSARRRRRGGIVDDGNGRTGF